MSIQEIINSLYINVVAKLPESSLHCDFSIDHVSIYLVDNVEDDCAIIDFTSDSENNTKKLAELIEWTENPIFKEFVNIEQKYNYDSN